MNVYLCIYIYTYMIIYVYIRIVETHEKYMLITSALLTLRMDAKGRESHQPSIPPGGHQMSNLPETNSLPLKNDGFQ